MRTNFENLILAEFLKAKKSSGQNYFWVLSDSDMNFGDESGVRTIIMYETTDVESDKELDEVGKLVHDAREKFKEIALKEDYTILSELGLEMIFVTPKGDKIVYHLSDNHLYLIFFYSGQY